jgi:hypothetical protein
MTDEVERVAITALTYRELHRSWSLFGPRTSGDDIVADLEAGRQDVSLLTLLASRAMSDLDWVIVRALDRPDVLASLLKDVAESEPWRAEAVLHALAAGGGWEATSFPASLVLAAVERWAEVEEALERWRDLGLTATTDDVFTTYLDAMEVATGRSRVSIECEFIDEMTTKVEEREGVV